MLLKTEAFEIKIKSNLLFTNKFCTQMKGQECSIKNYINFNVKLIVLETRAKLLEKTQSEDLVVASIPNYQRH